MPSTVSNPDSYVQTISNRDEPQTFAVETDAIELIELHDEPDGGVFPSLLSVYQQTLSPDPGYVSDGLGI